LRKREWVARYRCYLAAGLDGMLQYDDCRMGGYSPESALATVRYWAKRKAAA
jgi:hypothetical protein